MLQCCSSWAEAFPRRVCLPRLELRLPLVVFLPGIFTIFQAFKLIYLEFQLRYEGIFQAARAASDS